MTNFKKHSGNYISTKSLGIDFSLYSHSDYIVKTNTTMFKVFFLQICTTMINLFTGGSYDFNMVMERHTIGARELSKSSDIKLERGDKPRTDLSKHLWNSVTPYLWFLVHFHYMLNEEVICFCYCKRVRKHCHYWKFLNRWSGPVFVFGEVL